MSGLNEYADKGKVVFKLLFPSVILRWIVAMMVAIFLIAFALTELFRWQLTAAFALIAFINLGLIGALTIPTQMVALASSRTASYLGNARSLLLAVLLVFSVLVTLAICWGWSFTQLNHYSPLMLLGVWLMSSLMLQASVWLCSRQPGAHLFLLVFNVIIDDVIRWLELWNPLLIAFTLLMSWVVFGWWWINWRPVKYKVNPYFVGMVAQQKMVWERHSSSWFNAGPARSWLGSRLAGMPDGWVARSKRFLPRVVIATVGFIPGYIFMGDVWLKGFVHLFVSSLAVLIVPGMLSNYALNLRRIWLYSAGSRNDFFSLLQKRFWFDVVPISIVSILITFNLDLLWGSWRGTEAWLYFLLSLFLLQLLSFHLFWWVYQRTQASLLWPNLVCGVLVLWWSLMSIATGFLMKFPVGWQDLSPLWIVIPELVLLALLYKPVRLGFVKVNFARAG